MKYLILLLISTFAFAGSNNLPTESSQIIYLQHINKFKTALSGDLVPRDSSGNVGDLASDLGTSTYRFNNLMSKTLKLQKDNPGFSVTFAVPTMSSSYTTTWLAAPPSGTANLTMDSSGNIGTAGTRTEFVTFNTCGSSPCTMVTHSSGVSSVTRASAGNYNANFSPNFTSAPACTCSTGNAGTLCTPGDSNVLPSVSAVNLRNADAADHSMNIVCVGI